MPQRELKLYLWDIRGAGEDILRFTQGKELADYLQDAMLRAAVERKFEIIGEALSQAEHLYTPVSVTWWMIRRRLLPFAIA